MRILLSALIYGLFLLPLTACQAETEAVYEAGTHYEVLPQPVPTSDPTKIEVAEVFWYGCGHCFSFEPLVSEWKNQLPEDVVFIGVPAIWAPVMELHARAYYTAKALKALDKVHLPVFEAMNLQKKKLETEKEIEAIFVANGVSAEQFAKVFNSWGIGQQAKLSQVKQRGYRTQGTPELVVNGKYRISSRMTGGHEAMLKVASYLIEQERKADQ